MDLYGIFEHDLWPGQKITGARAHSWLDTNTMKPMYSAQLKTKSRKHYAHVLRKKVGCVYFDNKGDALEFAKKLKAEHNKSN